MTLMPVTRISASVDWSMKAGAWRWRDAGVLADLARSPEPDSAANGEEHHQPNDFFHDLIPRSEALTDATRPTPRFSRSAGGPDGFTLRIVSRDVLSHKPEVHALSRATRRSVAWRVARW